MTKKIVFIVFDYIVAESPSLVFLSIKLADSGFQVDIFHNRHINDRHVFDGHDVNVVRHCTDVFMPDRILRLASYLEDLKDRIRFNKLRALYGEIIVNPLNKLLFPILNYPFFLGQKRFRSLIRRYYDQHSPDLFFIVEPEGLFSGAPVAIECRKPFVYLSLELNNLSFERRGIWRKIKKFMEKRYHRKAVFTVIQDKTRKEIIQKDNNLDNHKFRYLPVSIPGPPIKNRSNFLRKKFNIDDNRPIVLYTGTLDFWTCMIDIVKSALDWPDDWVFIIHGPRNNSDYLLELKKLANNKENIIFSSHWYSYEQLPELISGGDVGLVFYQDYTINNICTEKASGKLAYYLKCGVPVVTSDFKGYRDLFRSYRCGEVCGKFRELETKIDLILKNSQKYREQSLECFQRLYNFDNYFEDILEELWLYSDS